MELNWTQHAHKDTASSEMGHGRSEVFPVAGVAVLLACGDSRAGDVAIHKVCTFPFPTDAGIVHAHAVRTISLFRIVGGERQRDREASA